MKVVHQTAAFLVCLLLLPTLGCGGEGTREEGRGDAPLRAEPVRLVLLHFNDFHGQLRPVPASWRPRREWVEGSPPLQGGAAVLAGYIGSVRREFAGKGEVVLLDTGDWFQGTPEGGHEGGSLVIEWFNRIGVAASVVGNHDYDLGWRNLVRLVERAHFPVLGANVVPAAEEPPALVSYLKPYWIREVAGVRLLFFGLITAETRRVTGGDVGNVRFRDEVETFRAWLPELRRRADQIALLTHCGYDRDRRIARDLKDVEELRFILGGHSHTPLRKHKLEGHIRIFQTGGKGAAINRIEYLVDPESRTLRFSRSRLVDLPVAEIEPDPETKAWLEARTTDLRREWDRPVGRLSSDLRRTRAKRSSSAGNLVADALRRAGKAKVGLTNKGGLRRNLAAGEITKRDIFELLPFDNTVVVLRLRGEQLVRVVKEHFEGSHSALEISGLVVRHAGGSVREVRFADGSPIEPERLYAVAVNSYMAGPGDRTGIFGRAPVSLDTGITMRSALMGMVEAGEELEVPVENRYHAE